MDEKVNHTIKFACNICNKYYASKSSLCNHNKKFHNNRNNYNTPLIQPFNNQKPIIKQSLNNLNNQCKFCNKIFSHYNNKWRHEKICKQKNINNEIDKLNESNKQKELELQLAKEESKILQLKLDTQKELSLKEENKKLKEELKNINIIKIKEDIDDIKNNINNPPINNQLINIISDKNKKIEELNKKQPLNQLIIEKQIQTFESLTLNNIVIKSRSDDNYINATQLCQAGGKQFNDWYRLNTTKHLINEAESETGIPVLQSKTGIPGLDSQSKPNINVSKLIDINKGGAHIGTWIHPDLAIQLAQWLSPKFALQVSKWIRQLFTNGKVEITTKLLTDNKLKDQEIQLLKDTYLKKHKRENYPDKNLIYILSTVDHLKNRIYIVGKAKNLKNRLSTYNKTCEHQVIYYKKCFDEDTLNLVELSVLNKLKQYQEKANRDRFILPIENDISLFINTIDNCINFFDQNNF